MPTYQYNCSNDHCTYEEDVFHSMLDKSKRYCPYCGKQVVKQIGRGSGIIFKGNGFYSKDYPKNKKGK